MQQQHEWLELFRSLGWRPEGARPAQCDALLVDGPALVDAGIGRSRSPRALASSLCEHVEDVSREVGAADAVVFFDSALRLPHARPAPWAGANSAPRNALRAHMTELWENDRVSFASCLHGDEGTTEWKNPLLKDPETRKALWRHPLLEWQLVHAIANEVVAWKHYPASLQRAAVTAAPTIKKGPWQQVWDHYRGSVESDFCNELGETKQRLGLFGAYSSKAAVYYLTTLLIGYRQPCAREWHRSTPAGPALRKLDLAADVYSQMAQFIYALYPRQEQKKEDPVFGAPAKPVAPLSPLSPRTVYVDHAGDEALWAFLFVLHRLRSAGHVLKLVVTWARTGETVDLSALYDHLRARAGRCPMEDVLFVMAAQNMTGLGARAHETSAARAWTAMRALQKYDMLSSVNNLYDASDPIANHQAVSAGDLDRSQTVAWCVSNFSVKEFAGVSLAASAHCLQTALGLQPSLKERRPSIVAVLLLYRDLKSLLPTDWHATLPLGPREALARARRTQWFFEYAYAASMPDRLVDVRGRSLDTADDNRSVWGFREDAGPTIDGESLLGALFDERLRVHSKTRDRKRAWMVLAFLRLTDLVVGT